MDLWLARLVLTHHRLHRLHQLPSATLPRDRVSSSFLLVVFLSGGLPFALVWLGLELLSSSLFFNRYSMRVALLFSPPWPPVWLPRLLSLWSDGRTVPLTLVLRLLASAELRLYRTRFPHLIISRTIWSEWTQQRWSSLAWSRMSFERIVGTCNLPATLVTLSLNYGTQLVLHWSVRYEATCCRGVLWFFKRPQVSRLEKQRNKQHDIWCLITNT